MPIKLIDVVLCKHVYLFMHKIVHGSTKVIKGHLILDVDVWGPTIPPSPNLAYLTTHVSLCSQSLQGKSVERTSFIVFCTNLN